jgi:hypothetical protein
MCHFAPYENARTALSAARHPLNTQRFLPTAHASFALSTKQPRAHSMLGLGGRIDRWVWFLSHSLVELSLVIDIAKHEDSEY